MRTTFLTAALTLLAGADWPGFRGPAGQGTSPETGLPTAWSATDNIAWKVPIDGAGWSSPVVGGGRVFVTTAADGGKSCRVLAFDALTGKPGFDVEVHRQELKRLESRNSPATPTPVVMGGRVFAAFNDGTLVGVDAATGAVQWVNRDFPYYSQHGLGSSPVAYRDLVVMAYDGSSEGPDKLVGWQKPWDKAVLVAFEQATGKVRWKASRGQSRVGHATPVVVSHDGRDVLVSPAGDVVQGFDPATGVMHWTVKAPGEGLVPSVSSAGGLAFSASGFGEPTLRAIRLGGSGDTTATHVAWKDRRRVSMMPSMIADPGEGGRLYVVTDKGDASCLDAATGKVVWEERLGASFSASPVLAGGHLYCLSDAGETFVLRAGDRYELVARNPLGESAQASLAVAGGLLYVRTKSTLWCVGAK